MEKLNWDKSTVESLHRNELDKVVSLLITPEYIDTVSSYLKTAFGENDVLSLNTLGERLSKFPLSEKECGEIGFMLFILSTELPEK